MFQKRALKSPILRNNFELYDTQEDPDENYNIAENPPAPPKAHCYAEQATQHVDQQGDWPKHGGIATGL